MRKRNLILFAGALGIMALAAFVTRSSWTGGGASAQGPQRARAVSVELAKAERKLVPVDVDWNGDADFQRRAEIAGRDHHRLGPLRRRRQGQRGRSAVYA